MKVSFTAYHHDIMNKTIDEIWVGNPEYKISILKICWGATASIIDTDIIRSAIRDTCL